MYAIGRPACELPRAMSWCDSANAPHATALNVRRLDLRFWNDACVQEGICLKVLEEHRHVWGPLDLSQRPSISRCAASLHS